MGLCADARENTAAAARVSCAAVQQPTHRSCRCCARQSRCHRCYLPLPNHQLPPALSRASPLLAFLCSWNCVRMHGSHERIV